MLVKTKAMVRGGPDSVQSGPELPPYDSDCHWKLKGTS